jgi:hypothetical protein
MMRRFARVSYLTDACIRDHSLAVELCSDSAFLEVAAVLQRKSFRELKTRCPLSLLLTTLSF